MKQVPNSQPMNIASHFTNWVFPATWHTLFVHPRFIMHILLTAIGLIPGGSSAVHIYPQTIHRKTQWNRIRKTYITIRIHKHKNSTTDAGNRIPLNVVKFLPEYAASHSTMHQSSLLTVVMVCLSVIWIVRILVTPNDVNPRAGWQESSCLQDTCSDYTLASVSAYRISGLVHNCSEVLLYHHYGRYWH
jgi:hypothetical protein